MYFVISMVLISLLSIYRYTTGKLPFYDRICSLSDRSLFVFIIVASIGLSSIHIHSGHDWGGDYAEYISQAQSILNGNMKEQVEVTSYMMSNSHIQHGPGAYPWGYPLMILPIIAVFGVNFTAIKYLNAVFYVLLIFALWSFSGRFLEKYYRVLLCGVMVLNVSFQSFLDEIFPDIVFCFFVVVTLHYIEKLYYDECNKTNAVLVGITSFFSLFIRSNGIILITTLLALDFIYLFIIYIIKRNDILTHIGVKKQRVMDHIIMYMVFAVPFTCSKIVFPKGDVGYSGYIDDISIKSVFGNIVYYIKTMPDFWQTGRLFSIFLSFFVLSLGIYIMILCVGEYAPMLAFCIEMGILLIVFPGVSQGIRYLYPIIMFLLIAMLDAMQRADKSRNRIIACMSIIVITAVVMSLFVNIRYVYEEFMYPDSHYSNYSQNELCEDMYEYIRLNTPARSIIISSKPRVIYLCTGRKGYSLGENNYTKISEADYALINTNSNGEWYNSYIYQQKYREAYSNKNLILYRIE